MIATVLDELKASALASLPAKIALVASARGVSLTTTFSVLDWAEVESEAVVPSFPCLAFDFEESRTGLQKITTGVRDGRHRVTLRYAHRSSDDAAKRHVIHVPEAILAWLDEYPIASRSPGKTVAKVSPPDGQEITVRQRLLALREGVHLWVAEVSFEVESRDAAIPAVASVSIAEPAFYITGTGQTKQLALVLKDAQGNALGARPATWTSDAPSVATASSSGLVTRQASGHAIITATCEGISATAALLDLTFLWEPTASIKPLVDPKENRLFTEAATQVLPLDASRWTRVANARTNGQFDGDMAASDPAITITAVADAPATDHLGLMSARRVQVPAHAPGQPPYYVWVSRSIAGQFPKDGALEAFGAFVQAFLKGFDASQAGKKVLLAYSLGAVGSQASADNYFAWLEITLGAHDPAPGKGWTYHAREATRIPGDQFVDTSDAVLVFPASPDRATDVLVSNLAVQPGRPPADTSSLAGILDFPVHPAYGLAVGGYGADNRVPDSDSPRSGAWTRTNVSVARAPGVLLPQSEIGDPNALEWELATFQPNGTVETAGAIDITTASADTSVAWCYAALKDPTGAAIADGAFRAEIVEYSGGVEVASRNAPLVLRHGHVYCERATGIQTAGLTRKFRLRHTGASARTVLVSRLGASPPVHALDKGLWPRLLLPRRDGGTVSPWSAGKHALQGCGDYLRIQEGFLLLRVRLPVNPHAIKDRTIRYRITDAGPAAQADNLHAISVQCDDGVNLSITFEMFHGGTPGGGGTDASVATVPVTAAMFPSMQEVDVGFRWSGRKIDAWVVSPTPDTAYAEGTSGIANTPGTPSWDTASRFYFGIDRDDWGGIRGWIKAVAMSKVAATPAQLAHLPRRWGARTAA